MTEYQRSNTTSDADAKAVDFLVGLIEDRQIDLVCRIEAAKVLMARQGGSSNNVTATSTPTRAAR